MQTSRSIRGLVNGRVQGVGFRYFVMSHARAESLRGFVRNLADGRVEFQLQGEADAVERVLGLIRRGPDYARVEQVTLSEVEPLDSGDEFIVLR